LNQLLIQSDIFGQSFYFFRWHGLLCFRSFFIYFVLLLFSGYGLGSRAYFVQLSQQVLKNKSAQSLSF
jgi:predicted Na+-dependent transporter